MNNNLLLLFVSAGSTIGILIILLSLKEILRNAPQLKTLQHEEQSLPTTSFSVIIPTYNEENRIKDCLISLLGNEEPCIKWEIIVIDDCSTDKTVSISNELKAEARIKSKNLQIINAGQRPKDKRWVGKNWPCWKASQDVNSDWILFIDADVVLNKFTLERALKQAIEEELDLLTIAPKIECTCLAEWMVQPIIATLLAIGFPIEKNNSPSQKNAFAAGPFMLFKKNSYEYIGGHNKVAGEVVEDIELAKLVKSNGLRLKFVLGIDAVNVRMYSNFSNLWEGWTKNWYLGLNGNIFKAISASLIVFWIYTIPWLIIPLATINIALGESNYSLILMSILFALTSLFLQYQLRKWCESKFGLPTNYWYLSGIGGFIIGFIGPASTWKTITGQGWKWKGRPLK